MPDNDFKLTPIGRVESPLTDPGTAPKQGFEGAPAATIAIDPAFERALEGIEPGQDVLVLTWFHLADRATLRVHPRSDPANPIQGVFNTRSPDRPNPIGLHPVRVVARDGLRIRVRDLEAVDATPVIDIKPVLHTGGTP